jgi:hypothetical protein
LNIGRPFRRIDKTTARYKIAVLDAYLASRSDGAAAEVPAA